MMIPDLCFFPIYLPVRYAMRIWSSIPFGHFTKYHVVHICNISPNKDILVLLSTIIGTKCAWAAIKHLLSLYLKVKRSHHIRRKGQEIPTLIGKKKEKDTYRWIL